MGKVSVTAKSDFFDRANQIQRKKGDQFVLRADYAKTVDVTIGKAEEKEKVEGSKARTSQKEKVEQPISREKKSIDKPTTKRRK